jgi:putative transposase
LWSEARTVTKVATVSLHGNIFEVDAALVGSRVEIVFNPFAMEAVEVRFQGRPMGQGFPVIIGRHSHPQARAEAAPAPAPTGIDYLGLLASRRDAELARSINYSQLRPPAAEQPVRTTDQNTAPTNENEEIQP